MITEFLVRVSTEGWIIVYIRNGVTATLPGTEVKILRIDDCIDAVGVEERIKKFGTRVRETKHA